MNVTKSAAACRGGKGKVTTGTSVDGRPTVPGLQTDCIPGVLGSDCSPAQVSFVKQEEKTGVDSKQNTTQNTSETEAEPDPETGPGTVQRAVLPVATPTHRLLLDSLGLALSFVDPES
jgi:hypothetical protein